MKKRNSVSTYIFCKDAKGEWCILAGKRRYGYWINKYNVPVGGVNPGEPFKYGAVRECREETGGRYKVSDLKFFSQFKGFWGACVQYYIIYNDRTYNHKLTKGDGENTPFEWIPVKDIDSYEWAFRMDKQIKKIYKENVVPKPKQLLFIDRLKHIKFICK